MPPAWTTSLETFLVEWKQDTAGGADGQIVGLETFLVEWKPRISRP